jgi:hypothetical protein
MSIRVFKNGDSYITLSKTSGFVDATGVKHPAEAHTMWSQAELEAIGVFDTVDDALQAGYQPTGWTFEFTAGQVLRHWTGTQLIPPPMAVSRYQFKQAILNAGKAAEAQTAINAASSEQKLRWSDAANIRRDSDLISYLKTSLSLTDAQVDNFFRAAKLIDD